MNTKIEFTHGELTYWEKIARTKWGSYLTEVEKRIILKANDLAGKPTTTYPTRTHDRLRHLTTISPWIAFVAQKIQKC